MPQLGKYVKAYPLDRFREFPGWKQAASELEGHAYLYLQENYVVTSNVFLDEGIVFNQVNDDWIKFCTETLNFSVPVWD